MDRIAVEGLNTLIDYRYQQHFQVPSAASHGMGQAADGKVDGEDVHSEGFLLGTQIFEAEDRETLHCRS